MDLHKIEFQLYDLGQNQSDLYDRAVTEAKIQDMERHFDLVMIAERFDESMVLLADLLCWPIEKVTSLKVNARSKFFINLRFGRKPFGQFLFYINFGTVFILCKIWAIFILCKIWDNFYPISTGKH
jgi:hypothetical protein